MGILWEYHGHITPHTIYLSPDDIISTEITTTIG